MPFNYYTLEQETMADEPYFAAGTHRLEQTPSSIPSTRQIEQDVDASLQQFPRECGFDISSDHTSQALDDPIDLSHLELDFDDNSWMSEAGPSLSSAQTTPFDNQDDFIAPPPKRVDSGLRATAQIFVPGNKQWQPQQPFDWNPNNLAPTPQSRDRNRMHHMTPIQTNMSALYHTPPMSAPSRPDIYSMHNGLATSPLISLTTEDSCVTSFPHFAPQGYQWQSQTPPAHDIDTWAHQNLDLIDPARLTPVTPVTPSIGGSALERSNSRTSRGSRTTIGPYICQHEDCGKEFRSKTEFSHHKRNHGERKHVCGICNKKFVFHKDLGRHEKVHTDERRMFGPIVEGCQWCAKGFQRKDHYERHMKTHSGRGDVLTPAGSTAAMSRTHSRQ